MARKEQDAFPCPICGAEVRAGARSCPECGADDETGWSDETLYDGLDLPEPEDMPRTERARPRGPRAYVIAAGILLAAILVGFLMRFAHVFD